jgi:trimeric autotransporter adhesin
LVNRTRFLLLFWLMYMYALAAADQPVATPYTIQSVAGSNSIGDSGPALQALFSQTEGIAVDGQGNVYVSDADANRIRKIGSNGTISTVAGTGVAGFAGDGGPANAAMLNQPYGLALDGAGNLFIADLGNARIREMTTNGSIQTVAGGGAVPQGGTALGGPALDATFTAPRNVALDPDGTLYISDFGANIVYRVSPAGNLTVLAGTGSAGYSGDASSSILAQLNSPAGIASDSNGAVYIADSGNNCIRKVFENVISTVFNATGPTGVAINGGSLYIASSNYLGTLYMPFTGVASALDVAADTAGNVFATTGQFAIEVTNVGTLNTIAGSGLNVYFGGDGGPALSARLHTPSGIALDSQGNKYIADTANHRIRQITPGGMISTIAGTGIAGADGDKGPATLATLNFPESVAIDSTNNLYIADTGNNKIRKITPDGNISTALDGLSNPEYVAVDQTGAIYIADTGNDRVLKMTPSGTPSVLAQVLKPAAVMVDGLGNIWLSELTRVSEISASGVLSIAVEPLQTPRGLALTTDGQLLIAETGTNLIRGWTSAGGLITVAGTGVQGFAGDGGPALAAELNAASDIAVDPNGVIWVADTGNSCIRTLSFSTPIVIPPEQVNGATMVNAASLAPGGVAPGEIVTIFGSGFALTGTQLLFDGKPATPFYIGAAQINALAPLSLTPGATTEISITVAGIVVDALSANVVGAMPGIFSVTGGIGQAAAINQDGTVNSASNPAARESVIVLYATGQGQDLGAVSLTIGGYSSGLLYAGPAPGFLGLMQINAQVPGGFLPPGILPVVLSIGSAASQPGVTIAVK